MDPRSSSMIRETESDFELADESPDDPSPLIVPFEIGFKKQPPSLDLPPAQARVIAVASGKGGTGKTTFTTNLAIALRKEGLRVLIVDADFGLANDHLLLGIEPKGDVADVIAGRKDIRDVLLEGPEGIHLIPGGVGLTDLSTLQDYEVQSLARDVGSLEPDYDIILLDLAAGVSPQIMRFLNPAHEIILVTNPEVTALLDAYGLIKCLSSWNVERKMEVQVIQNRVKSREDAIASMKKLRRGVSKHLSGIHMNFLGYIPFDHYLLHSISIQEPVILSHPRSFVTACFKGIAQKVHARYRSWDKNQQQKNPAISYFALLERQSYE
ncbi:MAG: P-loop NTPase [bacterium]